MSSSWKKSIKVLPGTQLETVTRTRAPGHQSSPRPIPGPGFAYTERREERNQVRGERRGLGCFMRPTLIQTGAVLKTRDNNDLDQVNW